MKRCEVLLVLNVFNLGKLTLQGKKTSQVCQREENYFIGVVEDNRG